MKKELFYRGCLLKRFLLYFILFHLSFFVVTAQVPAISRIEYFLDTDPGYGNATNLSFSGTTNATGTININLVPLSQGVHIVGVRSRDANGAWSLDNKWLFVKPFSTTAAAQPDVSRVEWYLDHDPGYGKATALAITPAQNLSGLSFNIDLGPLAQGVHIVGVRSKDVNGAWSHDNKWLFVKPYSSAAVTQPVVNRVEWYLDNDPGYGKANPLNISSGTDISGISFNIDMVPLTQGVHIVGVRSKDANGAWSHDNKWLFVKPYSSAAAILPNVSMVEWYLDTDPGYGKATGLAVSPAQNHSGLVFNIDLGPLAQGVHIVGVRSRDANGSWSLDNKWIFLKPYAAGSNIPVPQIVKMEYFIDVDPGYGKASPISITPGNDIGMLIFNANISNVTYGPHKLGIRSLDANGSWSLDNKVDFTGGSGTVWIGVTSTAWKTPSNWAKGLVPTINDDVIIPAGTPFSPLVSIGDNAACKSIKLNPGAVVTIATGANLKVNQ
jgi:hypothetical protein